MRNSSVPPHRNGDDSPAGDVIPVFVVEDNRLLREGIVRLLSKRPDISIVGAAPCSKSAMPGIRESRPRVVLVDSGLGDDDSERLVKCLSETTPGIRIIVMDVLPALVDVAGFSDAGASGFIMKDATTEEMVRVIRAVAAGQTVVPDPAAGSLLSQIARQAAGRPLRGVMRAVTMTKRERKIIALIGEGLSNREIARQLHVGSKSIRGHVHAIVSKLALRASMQSEIDFPT